MNQESGIRNQESGREIQDAKPQPDTFRFLSNPVSRLPNPAFMQRMRWRCRRGLLELDIVLGRFIETHYAHLNEAQQRAFDTLLDMPDTALWDMIAGRDLTPRQDEQGAVLKLLQAV